MKIEIAQRARKHFVPGHDIRHAVANACSSAPGSDRVLYTGSTADGNGFLEVVVLDNIEPNCAIHAIPLRPTNYRSLRGR